MPSSAAWVLDLGAGLQAATGPLETLHVVHQPTAYLVPGSPFYCQRVLVWEDQILPMMELAPWLYGAAHSEADQNNIIAVIVAYQDQPQQEPNYGALRLADLPRQINVDDEHACPLPDTPEGWSSIASACFEYQQWALPILDLATIFSSRLNHQEEAASD